MLSMIKRNTETRPCDRLWL